MANKITKSDCTTDAISKAFRMPYMQVLSELYSIAREKGHPVHSGVQYIRVPVDKSHWRPFVGYEREWLAGTYKTFIKRKRWLCATEYDFIYGTQNNLPPTCLLGGIMDNGREHMLAYVDGIEYDRSESVGRMRVNMLACPPFNFAGRLLTNVRSIFI